MKRARRAPLACVVAIVATLACAPAASATDVRVTGATLVVQDRSAADNVLDVRTALGAYDVYDDRFTLRPSGRACFAFDAHHVRCVVSRALTRMSVDSGPGNDIVEVGDVRIPVTATGGAGDDLIDGGSAKDDLKGGPGEDTIFGGAGDDALDGQDGGDLLLGDSGGDNLSGGDGADVMEGGAGGSDVLKGGAGRDLLDGGQGDDTLVGDEGSDTMVTGTGDDKVNTGTGADDVVFATSTKDTVTCGPGGAQVQISGSVPEGCDALPAAATPPKAWPPLDGAPGAELPSPATQIARAAASLTPGLPRNKKVDGQLLNLANPVRIGFTVPTNRQQVIPARGRISITRTKGKPYVSRLIEMQAGRWYRADMPRNAPKKGLKRVTILCCYG
jgi:hypothetical protein